MPSQRPSAAFDPIPPDLDLPLLVEETPNFEYVMRISCDMIAEQCLDSFDKLVLLHVILGGKPLVIEGFQERLDDWTFTSQWLQDNCGKKFEQARNLNKKQNLPISIGHYLNNMSKLTDQWNQNNYKDPDRQRIYLKDIDCPPIWHDKLREQIPPSVFYLNESTSELGAPGSRSALQQGAARAGDLMSCLPPAMRAENMMCYIGHEGTYTPAHREMCATLGQNLMVETSGTRGEDGKPAKPGSSIWFMTETNDRHLVSEYWLSTLGHDIEVESHFAQINAWKAAPFKTYIVDQRAGDFILIPPLAPHQVWNRGTRTMKAAWNRTTVETLEMALHEALPGARMVCRDEQYKNKAIIYFALEQYSDQLRQVQLQKLAASLKIRQLQKDFKRLFSLYTEILMSEMLDPVSKTEKRGQYLPYDSFVTCSYCRCNIFNRFLTCTCCVAPLENGDEDTYDICMDCYAMGRSCSCLSKYKWVEQFPWKDLVDKHDSWRHLIIEFEGGVNEKSPQPLHIERKNLSKKTLAQVCQEQLKARPFQDPKKPPPVISAWERRHPGSAAAAKDKDKDDQEISVDGEGFAKKSNSKKTRAEKLPKGWVIEHVSCYPEVQWKVATCSKCDRHYSYGSLFRMFDLMPQTIMENPEWECPACLKICSCGACRKKGTMQPHEPTGTVLGHDTKKVADPRSVESLVNFSLPNLGWIKRTGDDHPHESRRLSRRKDEAERAKAKDPTLDEHYVDEEEYPPPTADRADGLGIPYDSEPDLAIDPMLLMDQPTGQSSGTVNKPSNGVRPRSDQRRDGSEGNPESPDVSNHSLAPTAKMISHGDQVQGFTSNGITYEYPDPTASQSTSTFQAHQFVQEGGTANTKHSETSILQSDVATPPQNITNGHQFTQLEQMLEDAKLNDRYISTEAKFTEKTLPLALSVNGLKLAAIVNRPPVPKLVKPATNGLRSGAPVILQSDFPPNTQATPHMPKKRKARTENDEDFTSHKRRDRKSSNAQAGAKDTRKKAVKYTEPSSGSEIEEDTAFVPVNKPHGPRQLPKYIAQRTGQEGNTGNPSPSTRPSRSVTFATASPVEKSTAEPLLEPKDSEDVMMSEPGVATVHSASTAEVPTDSQISMPKTKTVRPNKQAKPKEEPIDPARKLAEDNRKAKMKALQWEESDKDASSDSDTSSSRTITGSAKKPLAAPKSIFSRPGAKGKKIRIVAAKSASVNGKAAQKAVNIARRSLGAL